MKKERKQKNHSPWNSSKKKFYSVIDSISFFRILLIWIAVNTAFGIFYFLFANSHSFLQVTQTGSAISTLQEAIYYSFITATATGFGDIVPVGFFRLLATIEAVTGLLVLAVITSKLISLKQNTILEEVYELTFSEKVNRLRASLLYFRQNLHNLIHKADDDSLTKRDISHLHTLFYSFQGTLQDMVDLVQRQKKHDVIKRIDDINASLLMNSIIQTFQRIIELIQSMEQKNISWKSKRNLTYLKNCIGINSELFKIMKKIKTVKTDTLQDLIHDFDKTSIQLDSFISEEKD